MHVHSAPAAWRECSRIGIGLSAKLYGASPSYLSFAHAESVRNEIMRLKIPQRRSTQVALEG